jgi:U3 small nucleolar RNA-associated protein 14
VPGCLFSPAQSLTLDEAKARAERLSRMRHLLFYAELKAKRLAKIKSKEHARRANRAAKRAAARLADAAGDEVAAARAAAEEAEFDRAKVRLTAGWCSWICWCASAMCSCVAAPLQLWLQHAHVVGDQLLPRHTAKPSSKHFV